MASDSDLKYATTADLAKALGMFLSVPSWDVAATPTNETVGTGDGENSTFYLDHQNIVYASYTLYANGVAMTDITHYSLDLDTGKITLTALGITLLASTALTAKYDYVDNGMKVSYLADVLLRAEKELEGDLNTTFTDGSATNPTYSSVTEIQSSEGFYQDRILTRKRPLIDISSTILADITAAVQSIVLASGGGAKFPNSGYIIIGSEVISYTGITTDTLTGCTRGSLGTTAATHSADDEVHSTILFRSGTDEGTDVSWTVQPWNSSMYANEFGLLYKFKDASPDFLNRTGVASRIKIIYYYGNNTIPQDIKRLAILLAKRMLIRDNVGKAMINGRDEFRPEMYNVDQDEINLIKGHYIVLNMGNT
jgi:hypothetical protein